MFISFHYRSLDSSAYSKTQHSFLFQHAQNQRTQWAHHHKGSGRPNHYNNKGSNFRNRPRNGRLVSPYQHHGGGGHYNHSHNYSRNRWPLAALDNPLLTFGCMRQLAADLWPHKTTCCLGPHETTCCWPLASPNNSLIIGCNLLLTFNQKR